MLAAFARARNFLRRQGSSLPSAGKCTKVNTRRAKRLFAGRRNIKRHSGQKEPGSYMGVSATTNVSGRKTMASTVGAESGDQRKTVVILSDRSREIIRLFEELQRK